MRPPFPKPADHRKARARWLRKFRKTDLYRLINLRVMEIWRSEETQREIRRRIFGDGPPRNLDGLASYIGAPTREDDAS